MLNVILLEACGQLFGIDAGRVVQVVDPPQVTQVPFLPPHVDGLVNVGGGVVVSVDLAAALGRQCEIKSGVSMVVRAGQGEFVLRVGRVLMMVPVDESRLHPVAPRQDGSAVVSGEFDWQGRMVLMIDPDRFELGEVDLESGGPGPDVFALAGAGEPAAKVADNRLPWLIVEVSGERYALDVRRITEVVEADSFLPVPKAPSQVLGYHSLRGAPLLVTSLAHLLEVAPGPVRHVVVVDSPAGPLGLGVARVVGIRAFDADSAEDVSDSTGAVAGCLVDADGSMLAILDLAHTLTPDTLDALAEYMPKGEGHAISAFGGGGTRRLLTFWLGEELCGIDLDAVSRVAEVQGWSDLPAEAGTQLTGVTQIGNEVMPLIDLRDRRGIANKAPAMAQVVARADGGACALAVDRMHRIIDLSIDDIRAVDDGGSD
ncbi:MAG TPA: chemotaxis protein CheW, partial [Candidatus Omnitrophota bacterium]|nr:chemotaxis protein CheW [Candidatus Omnitrophota bacterium]